MTASNALLTSIGGIYRARDGSGNRTEETTESTPPVALQGSDASCIFVLFCNASEALDERRGLIDRHHGRGRSLSTMIDRHTVIIEFFITKESKWSEVAVVLRNGA